MWVPKVGDLLISCGRKMDHKADTRAEQCGTDHSRSDIYLVLNTNIEPVVDDHYDAPFSTSLTLVEVRDLLVAGRDGVVRRRTFNLPYWDVLRVRA